MRKSFLCSAVKTRNQLQNRKSHSKVACGVMRVSM